MPGLEEGRHLGVLEQAARRVRSHVVPVLACGRGRPSYGFRGESAIEGFNFNSQNGRGGVRGAATTTRRGASGSGVVLLRSLQKVGQTHLNLRLDLINTETRDVGAGVGRCPTRVHVVVAGESLKFAEVGAEPGVAFVARAGLGH